MSEAYLGMKRKDVCRRLERLRRPKFAGCERSLKKCRLDTTSWWRKSQSSIEPRDDCVARQ
jgi:hypothetical protein